MHGDPADVIAADLALAGVQLGGPLVSELNVREILPTVRVPTLVVQHADDPFITPAMGKDVADHIPDAKYVELQGRNMYHFVEPWRMPVTVADVAEKIRRRQRFGQPIPQSFRELLDALNCALLADEHPVTPVLSRLKSTAELAGQWNCHPTTVRRKAQNAGGRKIGNRWVFHEEDV